MTQACRYSCVLLRSLLAAAVLALVATTANAQTLAGGLNHTVILNPTAQCGQSALTTMVSLATTARWRPRNLPSR